MKEFLVISTIVVSISGMMVVPAYLVDRHEHAVLCEWIVRHPICELVDEPRLGMSRTYNCGGNLGYVKVPNGECE